MNREQMVEKAARAMLEDDLAAARAADDWDHGADRAWLMSNARAVLDAILPQVTTVAELEALPWGSVVLTSYGVTFSWYDDEKRLRLGSHRWQPEDVLVNGPLTVVWQPEVTK